MCEAKIENGLYLPNDNVDLINSSCCRCCCFLFLLPCFLLFYFHNKQNVVFLSPCALRRSAYSDSHTRTGNEMWASQKENITRKSNENKIKAYMRRAKVRQRNDKIRKKSVARALLAYVRVWVERCWKCFGANSGDNSTIQSTHIQPNQTILLNLF